MARPRAHLAISLGLVALQLWRTGRLLPTLAPLVSGFLVDADHLIDHQLYRRSPERGKRVILALHGWEWLSLLAWLEARLLRRWSGYGLTLGLLAHLAVDQLTNDLAHPLVYSIGFRWAKGFNADCFQGKAGQHAWRETPIWQLWRWL